jgi:hypothetical protein
MPNSHSPVAYYRYVDDIWILIKKSKIEAFKESINKINKHIQFTFEEEIDGRIPFLDVSVTRKQLGFETDVYRKEISANTILHFHSYHAKSQKVGLIYFFVRRAVKICSTKEALDKELDFLRSNLLRTHTRQN